SFHDAPAVILAADAGDGLKVDFLERSLADVADDQVSGDAIETESPWIPKSVRPDLVAERIRRRHTVRKGADIDAQNLAEEHGAILAVVVWIAARSAVADAGVEKT